MKRKFDLVAIRTATIALRSRVSLIGARYSRLEDRLGDASGPMLPEATARTATNRRRMERANAALAEAAALIEEAETLISDASRRP